MSSDRMSADAVVALLQLEPHPEGGHYRETFRDTAATPGGRSASTAIYFLLREGEISAWHRIDAAEIWHWYAGDAILLETAAPDGAIVPHKLGPGLASGERPQAVVAPGHWQRARSTGAWTLVGCTVAPGFDFATFELAGENTVIGTESPR